MNISEMIAQVRFKIADEDIVRFTDAQILSVIQEVMRTARDIILEQRPMILANSPASGTVTAGNNRITLNFIPAKYIDVRCNGKMLHSTLIHYIEDTECRGIPNSFVVTGKNTIDLFPVPQQDVTYSITAVPLMAELTLQSELSSMSEFADLVTEATAARLGTIDEFNTNVEQQYSQMLSDGIRKRLGCYVPEKHFIKGYY